MVLLEDPGHQFAVEHSPLGCPRWFRGLQKPRHQGSHLMGSGPGLVADGERGPRRLGGSGRVAPLGPEFGPKVGMTLLQLVLAC